jgi:hypothetical protein
MYLPVNPCESRWLPRNARNDTGHDGHGTGNLERALGFTKCRAGVGHIVNKADSFSFDVSPTRDTKDASHSFCSLGRRHSRPTVQGADTFCGDQRRNDLTGPVTCRLFRE